MKQNKVVRFIDVRLLEGQVDLILRAMELYAFNLHHTWGINYDEDIQELRNALLFHTYEELINKKNNTEYQIGYDVTHNCRKILTSKKKKLYLRAKRKIA